MGERHDYVVTVRLTKWQAYELDEFAKANFGGSMSAAARALLFPRFVLPYEFRKLHEAIEDLGRMERWDMQDPQHYQRRYNAVIEAAGEVAQLPPAENPW